MAQVAAVADAFDVALDTETIEAIRTRVERIVTGIVQEDDDEMEALLLLL